MTGSGTERSADEVVASAVSSLAACDVAAASVGGGLSFAGSDGGTSGVSAEASACVSSRLLSPSSGGETSAVGSPSTGDGAGDKFSWSGCSILVRSAGVEVAGELTGSGGVGSRISDGEEGTDSGSAAEAAAPSAGRLDEGQLTDFGM